MNECRLEPLGFESLPPDRQDQANTRVFEKNPFVFAKRQAQDVARPVFVTLDDDMTERRAYTDQVGSGREHRLRLVPGPVQGSEYLGVQPNHAQRLQKPPELV